MASMKALALFLCFLVGEKFCHGDEALCDRNHPWLVKKAVMSAIKKIPVDVTGNMKEGGNFTMTGINTFRYIPGARVSCSEGIQRIDAYLYTEEAVHIDYARESKPDCKISFYTPVAILEVQFPKSVRSEEEFFENNVQRELTRARVFGGKMALDCPSNEGPKNHSDTDIFSVFKHVYWQKNIELILKAKIQNELATALGDWYRTELRRTPEWCDASHDATVKKMIRDVLNKMPPAYTSRAAEGYTFLEPLRNYDLTGLDKLYRDGPLDSKCANGTQVTKFDLFCKEPLVLSFHSIGESLEVIAHDVTITVGLIFSKDPYENSAIKGRRALDSFNDPVKFSVQMKKINVTIIDGNGSRTKTDCYICTTAWFLSTVRKAIGAGLQSQLKPKLEASVSEWCDAAHDHRIQNAINITLNQTENSARRELKPGMMLYLDEFHGYKITNVNYLRRTGPIRTSCGNGTLVSILYAFAFQDAVMPFNIELISSITIHGEFR